MDLIPGLGRSPGEGNCYSLQYSGLENSMNCIVLEVAKSRSWLSEFHLKQQKWSLRAITLQKRNKRSWERILMAWWITNLLSMEMPKAHPNSNDSRRMFEGPESTALSHLKIVKLQSRVWIKWPMLGQDWGYANLTRTGKAQKEQGLIWHIVPEGPIRVTWETSWSQSQKHSILLS